MARRGGSAPMPLRPRPCDRASRRTRRCPVAAGRRRRSAGRSSGGVHVARPGEEAPQARHRARISSPCRWSRLRLPARSCRSSTFCVTSSTSPGQCARDGRAPDAPRLGCTPGRAAGAAQIVEALHQGRIAGEGLRAWPHPRCDGLPTGRRRRERSGSPDSAEMPAPVSTTMDRPDRARH